MSAMMKKTDMIKLNLLESYENKCKENSVRILIENYIKLKFNPLIQELITICDELTRN